jgi:hypothetical protein
LLLSALISYVLIGPPGGEPFSGQPSRIMMSRRIPP